MRIRFTPRARADLDAVFLYVAAEIRRAAADLVQGIESLIEALSIIPDLSHPTRPRGRRVLTVPRAPYRVYSRNTGQEIRILTIRHTSRRPLRNNS